MLRRASVQLNLIRSASRFIPKQWEGEGVKYGHVTYYPRYPNHKDPPITPSKLLMVQRIKPWKGNPHWEKDTLTAIGIQEQGVEPVIVKNTPDMCAKLWSVKHLVKITPVDLPDNLPTAEHGVDTYLHESGKLYVFPKVEEEREKATEKFKTDPKVFEHARMKEILRLKWLRGYDF